MMLDSVTRSGLAKMADQFSYYNGVVVIDDLGKVDTAYSRHSTITTFAELCYSHFIEKHTISTHLSIKEFRGSAVLNIQPPILAQVIGAADWEAVTMDKTIRYYHLFRPVAPSQADIVIETRPSILLRDVELVGKYGDKWNYLCDLLACQWSDARLEQHLEDLLKSSAAWDGREKVEDDDYNMIHALSGPLTLEKHLVSKTGLELDRTLELNLLALLVELASWREPTVARICRDYKVSPQTVKRVIEYLPEYFRWEIEGPTRITVLPKTIEILQEAGAWE